MSSTIGNSDLLFRLVAMPTRFQLSGWQINFIESGPEPDPHDDMDMDPGADPEGGLMARDIRHN
jgi:hypothetical protein